MLRPFYPVVARRAAYDILYIHNLHVNAPRRYKFFNRRPTAVATEIRAARNPGGTERRNFLRVMLIRDVNINPVVVVVVVD